MRRILFLVAGEQQVDGIRYALSRGWEVHTLDNNSENPGHEIANKSHIIDVYDEKKVLNVALFVMPDAIVNFVSSHGLLSGIKSREALGLKSINRQAYEIIDSKRKFRSFLYANDFPCPKVIEIGEVSHAVKNHVLIAKPVHGGGSKGIVKIKDENELSLFLNKCELQEGQYIVEEYIEHDYRLNGDCIVVDNEIYFLVVGDYFYDKFNSIVAYATAFPCEYDQDKVEEFLASFVKKINYGTGAMNFELIVRNGSMYFIEVNPRHSGNFIHEIMSERYGIKAAEENVNIMLRDFVGMESMKKYRNAKCSTDKFYATALMFSKVEGVYEGLRIDANISPNILKLVEFKRKGDGVKKFETLYDRVALAVMEFDTREKMNDVLRAFSKHYHIELK